MITVIKNNMRVLSDAREAYLKTHRSDQKLVMPDLTREIMTRLTYDACVPFKTYPVTIDYGDPQDEHDRVKIFMDMVASGNYYSPDGDINLKNLSFSGSGVVCAEICFFQFSDDVSSVNKSGTKFRFETSKIEHCLAFGAQHPDVQRELNIVFIGSSYEVLGEPRVPLLYTHDRTLRDLSYLRFDVAHYNTFAAVCIKEI